MSQTDPNILQQYEIVGRISTLLMHSKMHRHFSMTDFRDIILPPVHLNQFRLYQNAQQEAIGLVVWGYFSESVEARFLKGQAVFSLEEWRSGQKLYITDFITKGSGEVTKQIVSDLKNNIFPNDIAYALRFDQPGQHRGRVSRYYGKNVQKQVIPNV